MTDIQQPEFRHRHNKNQRVKLTPEEAKVWHTCMKNSSIIKPTLFGAIIGYGIFKLTPFHAQAKYAALVTGMLGLISGRIAITPMCLSKVASMPNSTLKDRLMRADLYRNNKPVSEKQYQKQLQPSEMQSEIQNLENPSTDIVFDDYPPMNTYDTYSSINDNDFHVTKDTDLTEPQTGISYDELRNKNREEFYKKNKQWYTPKVADRRQANDTTGQLPTTNNIPPIKEKTKDEDVWN